MRLTTNLLNYCSLIHNHADAHNYQVSIFNFTYCWVLLVTLAIEECNTKCVGVNTNEQFYGDIYCSKFYKNATSRLSKLAYTVRASSPQLWQSSACRRSQRKARDVLRVLAIVVRGFNTDVQHGRQGLQNALAPPPCRRRRHVVDDVTEA